MKRNTILIGIIVVAVGIAAWRAVSFTGGDKMPDTADTNTNWMCFKCKQKVQLTSRKIQDRLDAKEFHQDGKTTTFKCDKCNDFTLFRAEECPLHHVWYCIGAKGDPGCQQCLKLK